MVDMDLRTLLREGQICTCAKYGVLVGYTIYFDPLPVEIVLNTCFIRLDWAI